MVNNYNFSHKNRGKAIVFSHYTYLPKLKLSDRRGTVKDVDALEKTLADLKFDVTVYHDRLEKEIRQILKNLSKEDHRENDCLAIVVLSHGNSDTIFAYDKEYPVDNLFENFLGENCPSLHGKPKLFFLQACRGSTYDKGFTYYADSADKDNNQLDPANLIKYHVPSTVDLLIMYSTFQKHVSWRNKSYGSWFIQSLCKGLEKFKDKDLLHTLTGVCHLVAYGKATYIPEENETYEFKQMPCIASTLTKMLYFDKKSYKNLQVTRFEREQREPLQFDEHITHTLFRLSARKTNYYKLQRFLNSNFSGYDYKIERIEKAWWNSPWSKSYDLNIPNELLNMVLREIEWPKDVLVVANTKQEN